MLSTVLLGLHITISLLLIVVVLMGRGSSAGGLGGGTSQTVFGSQGSSPFITKLTWVVAILFFATGLSFNLDQIDNQRRADALIKAAASTSSVSTLEKSAPTPQ